MSPGKLIGNVRICDGSGRREIFRGAVAVSPDGVIEEVFSGDPDRAVRESHENIDGGGLLASPGFIDAHSHSDLSVFTCPGRNTKLSCGITAEIVGNCGLSAFPVTALNRDHLEELWSAYGRKITWRDYSGYREALAKCGVKNRIISLLGHNTLRAACAGYEKKELAPAERAMMRDFALQAFRQGVPGISTGLLYVPGRFAPAGEVSELLRAVAEFSPVYATHLRSEGAGLPEAVREAVEICRAAGTSRLQISHFKTAGAANRGKLAPALEILRGSGLDVGCDAYAYTESMTQLSTILPGEWEDLPDRTITARLRSAEIRRKLVSELAESLTPERLKSVRLAGVPEGSRFRRFQGAMLEDICREAKMAPAEVIVELLAADSVNTLAAFGSIDPDNMRTVLRQNFCSGGSDENARPMDGSGGRGHPRGAGNPPRFLNILRSVGVPLREAVWRLTGLPAAQFRLPGIGLLRPGCRADILLWDPDRFVDRADFSSPLKPPDGLEAVFTGGERI